MEFQHSMGFWWNPLELMEEGKVLVQKGIFSIGKGWKVNSGGGGCGVGCGVG